MLHRLIPYLLPLALIVPVLAEPAEDLLRALRQRYPATQFNAVRAGPMSGLFEVVMGRNLAYTNGEGRHFLFGHLWDLQTQQDLTAVRKAEMAKTPWQDLPLGDALLIKRGAGRRQLAIFTDPDCPFCRELETSLQQLDDLTAYIFLMPLAGNQPDARRRSIAVWCAPDRQQAYRDAIAGRQLPNATDCPHPIDRVAQLAQALSIRGTPTMIRLDGQQIAGALSAEALDRWLDAARATP